MVLYDLNEFYQLSANLNMQLSAKSMAGRNILSIMLGSAPVSNQDKQVLLQVLSYLDAAYGSSKRRIGPPAVLHPLRATSLLARASKTPQTLDLLTCLLHDKLEDLPTKETSPERAHELETQFRRLLEAVDPERQWYLMERLDWLTRKPGQTYYDYIGKLLDHARTVPELIRVKLADRLDNTLDMRVGLEDPIQGVDFFGIVFRLLFVSAYKGYETTSEHPDPSPLNGAQRLYQLFKNAVLMSLLRSKLPDFSDPTSRKIFAALAQASVKEAQRILLHIFAYHGIGANEQRSLIADVMEYARSDGIARVTAPKHPEALDGLFLSSFEDITKEIRRTNLDLLYTNKPLMAKGALAFIVIFISFVEDPKFYVKGINEAGMRSDA